LESAGVEAEFIEDLTSVEDDVVEVADGETFIAVSSEGTVRGAISEISLGHRLACLVQRCERHEKESGDGSEPHLDDYAVVEVSKVSVGEECSDAV
jgi:hypothetical protein